MKPAPFQYHQPTNTQELLALLDLYRSNAKIISGGQSLAPMMNMRMAHIEELIDINQLSDLSFINQSQNQVKIGSMTRHEQVASSELINKHCPLLSYVAGTIGHYVIRQRGTIGGSLCHADPVAQMPLIALTLDANFHIKSIHEERQIRASDFFLGAMTTCLQENEFLQAISYPCFSNETAWAFELFNRRHGDYAIVSVALCLDYDNNQVIRNIRIGLNGVSDFAQDYSSACSSFLNQTFSEKWLDELTHYLLANFSPFDDERISSKYRLELAKTLIKKAFFRANQNYLKSRN